MGEVAGIPQWKRELILRRRAAASRPTSATSGFHQPPVSNMRLVATPAPAEEDPSSDSSEELQYGPGIVSKLKSKYMSMTLRESQQRPSLSSMRRATSLEDLLDGPENNKSRTRFKKATPDAVPNRNSNRYRAIHRGNDSLKRARSVEALVRCNPQVVIVESRLRGDDEPKKMERTPAQRPKRSQPPDLPRADLVKQTLRLFEKPKVSPKPASPPLSRKPPVFKPVTVKTSVVKIAPKPSAPTPPPVRGASPEPRNVSPISNGRASPDTQPRTISRKAIENIRAGGTSVEFSFGSGPNKSYLPQQQRLVGVIRPMVAPSNSTPVPAATTSITTTTTTIITTITCNSSSNHNTNTLSERELEKNLINRSKSNSNSGTGLWEQGRPWNQPHNTMVFNFADSAKPVPDYIENDGLILITRPKGNDSIRLSNTDGFNPSALSPPPSPPSPCDVQFEGDNILINGRSNLRKAPCIRKLHITFNDEATSTFEYPSESSLLQPDTDSPVTSPTSDAAPRSTPGVPVPLSGGSLANYQPSKVALSANDFELGVTRALPTPPRRNSEKIQDNNEHENETNGPEYLTPAEDGAAWGAAATEGLLF